MSESFEGKVALVTGAGSGIGQATALLFARHGAKVAVVVRNHERGQATLDAIRDAGGTAIVVEADMARAEQVEAMVDRTVAEFGRVDFAFNNAGITGDAAKLGDQSLGDWAEVIATNLTAVFLGMKYEIAQMLKSGGGVIINNASGAGVVPQPYLSPYCAAKHGVLGLTKTAAREYASDSIRVNAVCPGLISTPQLHGHFRDDPGALDKMIRETPMGRIGEPNDIARAVLFMCSSQATYMSGESMFIDGAYACH